MANTPKPLAPLPDAMLQEMQLKHPQAPPPLISSEPTTQPLSLSEAATF